MTIIYDKMLLCVVIFVIIALFSLFVNEHYYEILDDNENNVILIQFPWAE